MPGHKRGQKQRTRSIYTAEYKTFLARFRAARQKAGLTQEQVAERTGQTQAFVSRCERGERRLDIIELRSFLQAYGTSFTEFVLALDQELNEGSTEEKTTG